MTIPSHIAEGIQTALNSHIEFDFINLPIIDGVIAKHRGGGLVYVLGVDDGVADFLLIHTQDNMATDRDVILFENDTHLGYRLIVQSDVRGYTPVEYLTGKTISINLESALRGIRLKGRLDCRWDFKISEVHRLHQLMNYEEDN